jgi:hypothetical protein
MRMYKMLSDELGQETRVFTSYEEGGRRRVAGNGP